MPEANSNEDNEMPKLTVLDDYEELMKGRQKELNSLKEIGYDDSCKNGLRQLARERFKHDGWLVKRMDE